jgi:hypothetical protein
MNYFKTIGFVFLLFPVSELFAIDSNDNQQLVKALYTGKIVIPEINLPKIANIRSSLNNTLNRVSVSLNGANSRVKNSLDGTMGNIRKSINGTMDGIDEFFAGSEDAVDVAAVIGSMFIFMMAATNDNCYYYDYDYNCNGSYDHSYPRSYDPWR